MTTAWNENDKNAAIVLSNGSMTAAKTGGSSWDSCRANKPRVRGKWYYEIRVDSTADNNAMIGLAAYITALSSYTGADNYSYAYYGSNGQKAQNATWSAFGATFTTNDVVQVAVDLDAKKLWFGKNGTWQGGGNPAAGTGEAYATLTAGAYHPAVSIYGASSLTGRFTAAALGYAPPAGFAAWDNDSAYAPLYIFDANRKHASFVLENSEKTARINSGGTTVMALGLQPIVDTDIYLEFVLPQATAGQRLSVGLIANLATSYATEPGLMLSGAGYLLTGSKRVNNSSDLAFGATYSTNDVIGIAYEYATGKIWWSKNGVWQGGGNPTLKTNPAGTLGKPGVAVYPAASATAINDALTLRARGADFSFSPPVGFASYAGENTTRHAAATRILTPKSESSRLTTTLLRL